MPADPTPPAGGPPLPDLIHGGLDQETLDALQRDYLGCCTLLAVLPKAGAGMTAPASIPLDAGIAALRAGSLRGLQVRYHYDGAEWWDTLMRAPDGTLRIVRMQQDPPG